MNKILVPKIIQGLFFVNDFNVPTIETFSCGTSLTLSLVLKNIKKNIRCPLINIERMWLVQLNKGKLYIKFEQTSFYEIGAKQKIPGNTYISIAGDIIIGGDKFHLASINSSY